MKKTSHCQYDARYVQSFLEAVIGGVRASVPGTAKTFGILTLQLSLPALCNEDDQIREEESKQRISNLMSEETQKDSGDTNRRNFRSRPNPKPPVQDHANLAYHHHICN